jgi:para-nitrobenzyl esterase
MKALIRTLIFATALAAFSCSQNRPLTIVKVDGGKVEGVVEDGVTVFKGIPFAAPPVGDLRWKAPQPVIPWDSARKADKFGPSCPQMSMPSFVSGPFSEDCLYLNVWTPAKTSKDRLPVMVWIYGGGFAMGSTSNDLYDGIGLSKMGVIVVSVTYRVGALGFMAHPELTAESEHHVSGNYGLLDQIAGLRWVQNNITAFGGDPSSVTIFGESAGAISVSMLAASPLTKGLLTGAISESGASFWPVKNDRESDCMQMLNGAEKTGVEFMKRMGAYSLAELRKVSPDKWLKDSLSQMGGFWPVVDGYVIAGDQYKLYEEGKYNDVPVLIGTNSDEGSMFVRPVPPEQYVEGIKKRFGPVSGEILELYPIDSVTGTYRPLADIFRETAFAWPSWVWAKLQTKTGTSKVFVYYFDEYNPGPIYPNGPAAAGAAHGSEIAYVFRHLDSNHQSTASDEQRALSATMATYWTNFAKSGDPNGEGLPDWPVFRDGDNTVMYLKGAPHQGPVPNLDKLEVMDKYFAWKRSKE